MVLHKLKCVDVLKEVSVGVGGHAAHGGYGMVSRKYGLTLDWMKDATVVLHNGTIVYCSESEHSDLFWAIRGAGSSFGIVAEYGFETFPAPEKVTNFGIVLDWDPETAPSGLLAFQDFAQTMPSELSCQIDVRSTGYTLNGSYVGNEDSLREALVPLLGKIGGHLEVHEGNWLEYVKFWALGQPNIDITPPADNVVSRLPQRNVPGTCRLKSNLAFVALHNWRPYPISLGQSIQIFCRLYRHRRYKERQFMVDPTVHTWRPVFCY